MPLQHKEFLFMLETPLGVLCQTKVIVTTTVPASDMLDDCPRKFIEGFKNCYAANGIKLISTNIVERSNAEFV